ncbi:MAG: FscB, partial [Rubrimonas sp.]
MSHVLHLGHQPTDVSGVAGLMSTAAAGFDPALDVNGVRFVGSSSLALSFAAAHRAPLGDLWLGFRYVPPNSDAHGINQTSASFLEFHDASGAMMARVRPLASDDRYHAEALGDATVQGASSYIAPSGQPQWIDVRLAVGAEITIEFFVDGVLRSAAAAPNAAGKGKPVLTVFANRGLHDSSSSRTWYYAHIAILDGVSTIGRRFARRTPDTVATYAEMTGALDALKDEDVATRVTSGAPGQRLSFSLAGPNGPDGSVIAGVHLKAIAQGGVEGPQALAGF